jgi:flagellar basal-body rod modification protein FlgD
MTTPIGNPFAAPAAAATTGTSTTRTTSDTLGKDTFLKLLVAQMKYQDPSQPADSTQFLAQTAQFSMLEKLSDVATSQHDLLSAQLMLGASNLVGRTVTYTGTDGREATGVVTSASFTGSSPTLKVGNTDVPLSSVKEVRSTSGTS